MDVALLVLRVIVGALFAAHGAQKLFGWFGGHGLTGTGRFFESVGIKPGRPAAAAAGLAELIGGLMFAAGLLTPVAAALIIAVMTAAIARVHWRQGLWVTEGGAEYSLVLITVAFAVTATGPGDLSLDQALGVDAVGLDWALGALITGLLAGLVGAAAGQLQAGRHAGRARPAGP
jgi:putative oxidoreductase